MVCKVCRDGLEGIWDPNKTRRVGVRNREWLENVFPGLDDEELIDDLTDEEESQHTEPEKCIFAHHATRESCERSKEQGCIPCSSLLQFKSWEVLGDSRATLFQLMGCFSVFIIMRNDGWREDNVFWIALYSVISSDFYRLEPHHGPKPNLNYELSPYSGGEPTFLLIKQWYDNCLRSHEFCNSRTTVSFVPSRIVELCDENGETNFRIIEREHIIPGSGYMTLSYCWGTKKPNEKFLLLKSSQHQLMKYQPISILPKTFREAMAFTMRFSVRYLWIDRLCIFQDSDDDWTREAATMGDVYRNSLLNISALSAADDEGGCFFSRDPADRAPTIVHLPYDDAEDARPYRISDESRWDWQDEFYKEPLPRRGWTLQERLLAPRVVHFGRGQVFWECGERNCCEVRPRNLRKQSSGSRYYDNEEAPETGWLPSGMWNRLLGSIGSGGNGVKPLFQEWGWVVEKYSACQLTKPADKLVAISGLAKDMKEHLRKRGCETDVYLAGLWKYELSHSLLWRIEDLSARRPAEYRAPSWSWASIDGGIRFPRTPTKVLPQGIQALMASLVHCKCVPSGVDEMGKVIDGVVILEGPLALAKLVIMPTNMLSPPLARMLGDTSGHHRHIASLRRPGAEEGAAVAKAGDEAKWMVRFDVEEEMCDEAYCIPIAAVSYSDLWIIHGVALARIGNDRYVRLGIFIISSSDEAATKELVKEFPKAIVHIR